MLTGNWKGHGEELLEEFGAELLEELGASVSGGTRVATVAGQRFGDQSRFAQRRAITTEVVTGFREAMRVTDQFGKSGPATESLTRPGRAKLGRRRR